MRAIRFGVVLVLAAAAATALLWWLGYWVIAFAVGIAVLVVGGVAYVASRTGARHGRTPDGGTHSHLAAQ
ncbi:MAG TPA: hypothetical protein VF902_00045 [Coriobacteriia bacterium]